jgi:hypothetical protein
MVIFTGARRSHHQPDIGDLRRGEHLVEDFDGMSGGISSVVMQVS